VVLNAQGEVIFVPKLGCNVSHYSIKPNFFMIELLNTEVLSNA
jgi:tRNA(Ile)-lysidine synthase